MKTLNLNAFVNSYLETASWVTCDSGENTEFTRDAKKWAKSHCQTFIDKCVEAMGEDKAIAALSVAGNDLDYIAPHDLFLSESGHGAGFWDYCKDYGGNEISDQLQKVAESMGPQSCYHVRGPKSKLTF